LVSDGEDMSTPELLKYVGGVIGCPARLFPLPIPFLILAGKLAGKSNHVSRLAGSLCIDIGKIRSELGWIPPFSSHQGLRATGEYFLKHSKK
jgi:nucleoside-diphosphate-sugar epimerase